MIKFAFILSIIALAMANSISSKVDTNVLVKVVTPQEMENFLKQNPEAQPLNREVSQKSEVMGETRDNIRYTLGSRQSGDRLVDLDSGRNSWSSPQNVRLTIRYPASGTGAIVTFVLIEVNQSSSSGRAYVTSGGIGYRYITIVVEANNTYWFNWAYNIYGK